MLKPMIRARIVLLITLFFIHSSSMIISGCSTRNTDPYCAYFYKGYITAWNSAGSKPHIVTDSGVAAMELMLQVMFQDTVYLCQYSVYRYTDGAAYARKSKISFVYIDSVHIVSNNEFDATHPAGTNLVDLFSNSDLNAGIYTDSVVLFLKRPPADTGTHIFTITTFTADTLKNIKISSSPIKLLL